MAAVALAVVASPAGAGQPPVFRHLTTADGLPHDSVYAVLQDATGFLWLATEDGLARWDGLEMRAYRHDPEDPGSLPQGDVNALAGGDGVLWVGTWGAGVVRFDPRTERFARLPDDPEVAVARVQSLALDGDVLWIATYSSGLHRYDTTSGALVSFRPDDADPASLAHDHVWTVAPDPGGGLWVATQDGLDYLSATAAAGRGEAGFRHFTEAEGLPAREVIDVLVDSAGNVWAGTVAGMAVRRPGATTFTPAIPDARSLLGPGRDAIREVIEDREGVLWIATRDRGLLRFDPTTGAALHLGHDARDRSSLASDDVRALHIDRAGNLWIGTRGGGADRLDLKPPKFTRYLAEDDGPGLSHHRVWALHEDRRGVLWIGTSDGLDRFDRRRGAWSTYRHDPGDPTSLPHNTVRALAAAPGGGLWVGTNGGGLALLDERGAAATGRFRHPVRELRDDVVWTLHHDAAGVLWVGTGAAGLVRLDPATGAVTRYRHDPADPLSLPHDRVLAIAEDRAGVLWIGTDGGGLAAFDRARGHFRRYRHDRGDPASLSNDSVLAVAEDARGVLWVGTHGGLNRLGPDRQGFALVSERDGLPDNVVYAVLEDGRGRLWLPTNRGLARFDPATGDVRAYGPEDGLQSLGFNEGAAAVTADGEMLVGGIRGFNTFFPEDVADNPHAPPVVFTGVHVFNEDRDLDAPVWALGRVEVSHKDAFAVRFAALDFTAPGRNRYAWRLGFDSWTETDRPSATFSGLDPGEHRLEVRAANNDGVWSERPAALVLAVTAPPWRRPLVQLAAAIVLAGAAVAGHRLRTRAIKRRSRELEALVERHTAELRERSERLEAANEETRRFAYLVSHDLRSPLVTIQGFVGELRSAAEELRRLAAPLLPRLDPAGRRRAEAILEREMPEALAFLEGAAARLDRMTRSILRLARLGSREPELERVDLERLVAKVVDDLAHPIAASGAAVDVGRLPEVVADRDALERIFENLVGNAVKYLDPARPGRVTIRARRETAGVAIDVADNGRGMSEEDVPRAFEALRRIGRQDTEGEGMGLAYVKALVRRHGGRIEARSVLGEGTTFTVYLPDLVDPEPVTGIIPADLRAAAARAARERRAS